MKRTLQSILGTCGLAALLLASQLDDANAQQRKRAQTSMKFLSTSNYAHASGMADAVTAFDGGGAWMQLYNPAALAWTEQRVDVAGSVNEWIAGIEYSSLAATLRFGEGRLGVLGFNMTSVNYGDLQRTIRADNERGYLDAGTFSPTAFSFGISYAKSLSDQFSVGANMKFVTQDLGAGVVELTERNTFVEQSYKADATVVDFGVFYRTSFESLKFAMTVRNFSPDVKFDSRDHELPLTFKMGVSMDVMDLMDVDKTKHSLLVNVDANRPRDYNEQIQVGAQYTFLNVFVLRGGYVFPSDEEGYSLGFGVKGSMRGKHFISADYSYSDFGIFSSVNRISFRLSI